VRTISAAERTARSTSNRRRRASALAFAAVAATLVLATLVPTATGHPVPPIVTAQHAFVGDPLFGLETQAGTLFAISPNERTAMASTTKVWTLDVTAHALDQGKVHLGDKVTITKSEANVGGSSMKDVNGTPLEKGEIVTLEALIRGMMYQSGNNATYAIARHVAQAYFSPASDWHDFVDIMNSHAAAAGLTDTHFENPNGFDDSTHFTTARELARQLQHGLEDPYFAEVVGFKGTYIATTQGPKGPKTYKLASGQPYPGWEGEKNGITPDCNGNAQGCIVRSATRLGRRVVVATMQGSRGPEEWGLLDHGFATIFHPDLRGTSAPLGGAEAHAVDCFATGFVTAVLPPSLPAKLNVWKANVDTSSLTKVAEASLAGSVPHVSSRDVAVTSLATGDIIMATRTGTGIQLSRWQIGRYGGLTLLTSGVTGGTGTSIGLQPVAPDMFLTAVTDPYGAIVLKSWRLQGSGLVNLDTYQFGAGWSEIAIAGPLTSDVYNGHKAVTAAVAPDLGNTVVHQVWGVDPATGQITQLGSKFTSAKGTHVTLSPFPVTPAFAGELLPSYYATGFRDDLGNLALRFFRIDGAGSPVDEGAGNAYGGPQFGNPAGDQLRLAPLGTSGVLAITRDSLGALNAGVLEARRNADDTISPGWLSSHWLGDADSLDVCRLPSNHAEGDYVTATGDGDGQLRLRAYRVGDRPY
jgi:D-alanyl-D-alanine carboxypeptidase